MIYYKKRKKWKYVLQKDYTCQADIPVDELCDLAFLKLEKNGNLTIKKNYAFDGATGLIFTPKSLIKGSLIHDALYQLIREKKIDIKCKKIADEILAQNCIESKIPKIFVWLVSLGVRLFGRFFIKDDILTAP